MRPTAAEAVRMLAELGLDAGLGAVYVGAWASLLLCAGIGFAACVSHRRNADPSDLTALFAGDTAEFPREYRGQRRRPRSWRSGRQPVCRPRTPAGQRNTVRLQVFDPPEGGGRL